MVDIISRDLYPPEHQHTSHLDKLAELQQITPTRKIALLGEIGTLPDVDALAQDRAEWVSYMTWCGDFVMSEKWTDNAVLRAMYDSPWAVTKDRLPELY